VARRRKEAEANGDVIKIDDDDVVVIA